MNPNQNLNQDSDRDSDRNLNRNQDRNQDRNSDRNLNRNQDQNPNQSQNRNSDRNLNRSQDRNPNRDLVRNLNRDLDRDLNRNSNRNAKSRVTLAEFIEKDLAELENDRLMVEPDFTPGNTRSVICLRLVNAAILVAAVAMTASGLGIVPNPVPTRVSASGDSLEIIPNPQPWRELGDAGTMTMIGQFFILMTEMSVLSLSFVTIMYRLVVLDHGNRGWESTMFIIGGVFLLVAGCLEAWFATGFGHMDRDGIDYTIYGWVAASLALFLAAGISFGDAFTALKNFSLIPTAEARPIEFPTGKSPYDFGEYPTPWASARSP